MEKQMEEETFQKTLLPIVIEVKSFLDLIEACPGGMIFHKSLKKHYYYYYISIGESLIIMMVLKTDVIYKRYVGLKSKKILESDEANSDCFIPIIEILVDPIVELSIIEEDEHDQENKIVS